MRMIRHDWGVSYSANPSAPNIEQASTGIVHGRPSFIPPAAILTHGGLLSFMSISGSICVFFLT
jgi:hypothetical protein